MTDAVRNANLPLWRVAGQTVKRRATEALQADEVAVDFVQAASEIKIAATAHFTSTGPGGPDDRPGETTRPGEDDDPVPPQPPTDTAADSREDQKTLRTQADVEALSAQLRTALSPGQTLVVTWRLGPVS